MNPSRSRSAAPRARPLDGREALPQVWLMLSHRAGDSTQVLALAEALGWPCEVVAPRPRKRAPAGEAQSELGWTPVSAGVRPWPDLVISAGWRSEVRARSVRALAARDGQRVRLVHVGRPWFSRDGFDLVVTPPQYRLPVREHILHNETPLHAVTQGRLAEAAEAWRPRLAELPRPYVSVLVGGHSGPYNFGPEAARRLIDQAARFAEELGGSLLVTTSARTPEAVREVLAAGIRGPHYLHQWRPGGEDNPYYAFLALGEHLIVTCDSVSMLTEACATRKPVHIFDIGTGSAENAPRLDPARLRAGLYGWFLRYGPKRFTRDLSLVHEGLIASRRAVWLGQNVTHWRAPAPLDSVARAVARVHGLLEPAATRIEVSPRVGSASLSRREAS